MPPKPPQAAHATRRGMVRARNPAGLDSTDKGEATSSSTRRTDPRGHLRGHARRAEAGLRRRHGHGRQRTGRQRRRRSPRRRRRAAAAHWSDSGRADRRRRPVGREPKMVTITPIGAVRKLRPKVGWTLDEVDLFEINEAFAAVTMAAVKRELGIDAAKVNVFGGAVALGHPIGCERRASPDHAAVRAQADRGRRGIARLCVGGGKRSRWPSNDGERPAARALPIDGRSVRAPWTSSHALKFSFL